MAAPTKTVVKLDLYDSTLDRGVTSYLNDGATRRCHVSELTPSNENEPDPTLHDLLHRAAEAAITEAGLFHQNITDLPLESVKATQHGPTSAWVKLKYERGRWGTLPNPANVIASSRGSFTMLSLFKLPYKVTFDTNGNPIVTPKFDVGLGSGNTHLPAGDLLVIKKTDTGRPGKDAYRRPETYNWERQEVQFFLPTFRSDNPLSVLDQLIGKVNDASIMVGGMEFVANTLLLEAPNLDWTQNRNGDWWEIDYVLRASPIGFNVQHIRIADKGEVDDEGNLIEHEWTTKNGPEFQQVSFAPLVSIF